MPDDVKNVYKEEFEYLNLLRDSGETNMWGASTYLISEFGMESDEARKILSSWMDSFKEE